MGEAIVAAFVTVLGFILAFALTVFTFSYLTAAVWVTFKLFGIDVDGFTS